MSKILLRHKKLFSSDVQYQIVSVLAIFLFVCSYFFGIDYAGIALLLLFPSTLLIKFTLRSILLVLPLAVGLNALFIAAAMVILDLVGLPISIYSAYVVVIIISAIAVSSNLRYKRKLFSHLTSTNSNIAVLPIYILFCLGIFSRLISVIEAEVPLSHDPEAHAFWTKRILTEKAINYFYSPGLHIWASFLSFASDLSIAKTINILTNFLSSLSILFWGLASYALTKNKMTSTFVAFIVLIIPMPANVYFLAGKNSLIAVLPFFALLFIFAKSYFSDKRSLSNGIGLGIVLAGIATVHYPSFVYAAIFSGLYALYAILIKDKFSFKKDPLIASTLFLSPIIVSVLFASAFVYKTYSSSPKIPIIASRESGARFHEISSKNRPADPASLSAQKGRIVSNIDIKNPKNSVPSFLKNISIFISKTSGKLGIMLFGIALIAWYFIFNNLSRKNLENDPLMLLSVILGLSLFLTMALLNVVVIKSLNIVESTGYFLILIFSSLVIGGLLSYLTKIRYLIVSILLIFIGAYSSFGVYKNFNTRSSTATVNNADIDAFNWINESGIKDTGFVGTSVLSPSRKHVVFSNDGSTWLPVFTSNYIATPFHDLGFLAISSHVNYEYTRLLSSGDLAEQKDAIQHYTDNGFEYLYIDGEKGKTSLSTDSLIDNGLLKIIYSNNEVAIGRFNK